jgi:hypothetical protein
VTRTEIIELSNQLTERKGERQLNTQSLYRFVVQDICKRQRFWWRRIVFSFPLVSGTPTYDLTQVVTTPANAMTEIAIEEITKFTVILSPTPFQVAEFVPVFDPETLIDMINNTSLTSPTQGNTQSPGGRYTIDPSGNNVIRIDPPDLNYTAYLVGWAMPNAASDSANDAVPLIPTWGHNTIVEGMNAKIFRFAYGAKNEKTTDAQAAYELGIQDLASKKQFDPSYRLQMSLTEDAVRST